MARLRFLSLAPFLLVPLVPPAAAEPAAAPERAPTTASSAAVSPAPAELLRRDFPPGRAGGRLVVALAAEPRGFNPLTATDNPSLTLLYLLHADLWHIDRGSQATVPALARKLTPSADGRRYRAELRRGLRFSDGQPLDADDVVFTFGALLDDEVGAVGAAALSFGEGPEAKLEVRKVDDYTVDFFLPQPYASGERIFDSQAILPEHLLGPAYRAGKLADAWGLGSDPATIAGLGPFRLKSHVPGEKLVLERNPYYWQEDAAGRPLPYLDEIVFLFVPDETARVLRFEAGDTQVAGPLGAESFARLERLAAERGKEAGFRLFDRGPGLTYHVLFFNLNQIDPVARPELARKQEWFRRQGFRQAVSLAIDRAAMVRLVYRGKASAIASHVSPGNQLFADPGAAEKPRDLEAARRLLVAAGFHYGDGGELLDEKNARVAFTVATNASNRERVQLATLLQADLAALGMAVEVAPLEFRSLIERVTASFDYDAGILGLGGGDPDPNSTLNVWQSEGRSHLWQLGGQAVYPFEKKLDGLMAKQMVERDPAKRRALLAEAQALIHDEEPLIALVTPHLLAAAREGLERFAPSVVDPPTLWNAEELSWRSAQP